MLPTPTLPAAQLPFAGALNGLGYKILDAVVVEINV
jgi:hypothetical protein